MKRETSPPRFRKRNEAAQPSLLCCTLLWCGPARSHHALVSGIGARAADHRTFLRHLHAHEQARSRASKFSRPSFRLHSSVVDAENVAPGQDVTIDALDAWLSSRQHCRACRPATTTSKLWRISTRVTTAPTVIRSWAHAQWDGQVFSLSPGNLRSAVEKIHLDPSAGISTHFNLDQVISQREIEDLLGGEGYSSDTPWIKHLRIKSPSLTKFWGTPIYLGATVLLPKGYASHPNAHYPVVYNQGHFYQPVPWDFTTDAKTETPQAAAEGKAAGVGTGYEFYQAWNSNHFPRFLMVTWQHPCPFFDDSYAVNSANCGPFGDAIMNELIPHVESRFRVLREPRARLLEGGSTGGWESLALQEQHPNVLRRRLRFRSGSRRFPCLSTREPLRRSKCLSGAAIRWLAPLRTSVEPAPDRASLMH